MDACVTENTLAGFLEGRLSGQAATELQDHVARCSSCRALLVELASAASIPRAGQADSQGSSAAAGGSALGATQSDPGGTSTFNPPSQLDEYRVLGFLGQGSMGRVYLGRDTRLDRLVAIKFLVADSRDERHRGRLLTEARAIARIQHPNVVSVYRVGEHNGQLYLVSEFVHGQSLDRLAQPLPWPQVLQIGIALAGGLAAAHGQGVLHRDIKPANVILTGDGQVKLLDFGLAKLASASSEGTTGEPALTVAAESEPPTPVGTGSMLEPLTQSGMLVGTPRYMAPELWRGEAATARSDLYALGALLYELCSGRVPHHAVVRLAELRERVQREELPELHQILSTSLPREFSGAVMRCLRPQPSERTATAGELLLQLMAIQQRPQLPPIPIARRQRWRPALLVAAAGILSMGLWLWLGGLSGWRDLPRMNVGRGYACAAYVPDAVYVFGGLTEAAPDLLSARPQAGVERFDFATQRWSPAAAMPIATFASRCVVVDGRIYVMGGRAASPQGLNTPTNLVQVFDPVQNRWWAAAPMPRARSWFGAAVLGRKIYAIGGAGQRTPEAKNGYLDSADMYDPDRNQWSPLSARITSGRYMLGVTAQSGRIYVVGGSSFPDPTDHPDIQAVTLYTIIEEFAENQGRFQIRSRLPGPIGEVEIYPFNDQSLLLSDTRFLYDMQLRDGVLTKLAPLQPGVVSHDSAIIPTPHGLFAVGGGGSNPQTAKAYLYRPPPPKADHRPVGPPQ